MLIESLEARMLLAQTLVEGQVVTGYLTEEVPEVVYQFEATAGMTVPLFIGDTAEFTLYRSQAHQSPFYSGPRFRLEGPDGEQVVPIYDGMRIDVPISQSGTHSLYVTAENMRVGIPQQFDFSWGRKLDLVVRLMPQAPHVSLGIDGTVFLENLDTGIFEDSRGTNDAAILNSLTIVAIGSQRARYTVENVGVPVIIRAGSGNDNITIDNPETTVYGGWGDDAIVGSAGGGEFRGGLGNDTISSSSPRDIIRGGEGENVITGGSLESDMNGDGIEDAIRVDPVTGQVVVEYGGGGSELLGVADLSEWSLYDTGHFNDDEVLDLLWVHRASGQIGTWLTGVTPRYQTLGNAEMKNWQVLGAADLTGNGTSDIVFLNRDTRLVGAWILGESPTPGWSNIGYHENRSYLFAGFADRNSDGVTDLLFRSDENEVVWYIQDASVESATSSALA